MIYSEKDELMFKVYGKPMCSSCDATKRFLQTKGVEYEYFTLGKDYTMQEFMRIKEGHRSFPLITQVIDGEESYVGGLEQLKQLLK